MSINGSQPLDVVDTPPQATFQLLLAQTGHVHEFLQHYPRSLKPIKLDDAQVGTTLLDPVDESDSIFYDRLLGPWPCMPAGISDVCMMW